uniref:Uncharacterized protein n=1 Tax=Avena sativa TaxID=4498 RepID=A0ACD5VE47_AVESA
MEVGDYSGKYASEVEVKLEEGEVMQDGGDGGGSALVAVEAMTEPPQVDIRMDVALLHCHTCHHPLKPPVYKCDAAGHIVCFYCRAGHGDICSRASTHCPELDAVVGAAKVPCPYRAFGCEQYVVYHGAADHQRACQCAPCSCPESGCPFVGSRGMLLDHIAAAHSRLAVTVRYGRSSNLNFPLSQSWHALVAEEDRSVFLVSLGALGAATAVSLVCVQEDGVPAAPQFWCKLFVDRTGEDKDKDKLVLMASTVGSSTLTDGVPAPGQGMFLAVPQELLSGEMLALNIRIDHLRPAAATKSTTPRARTPGRMQ